MPESKETLTENQFAEVNELLPSAEASTISVDSGSAPALSPESADNGLWSAIRVSLRGSHRDYTQ
jgi:hypothetical protein